MTASKLCQCESFEYFSKKITKEKIRRSNDRPFLMMKNITDDRTDRKSAATLCQVGRHTFTAADLKIVPEWPLVYWWDDAMLRAYQSAPLIGKVSPARQGLATGK